MRMVENGTLYIKFAKDNQFGSLKIAIQIRKDYIWTMMDIWSSTTVMGQSYGHFFLRMVNLKKRDWF